MGCLRLFQSGDRSIAVGARRSMEEVSREKGVKGSIYLIEQ
jgi:hypothetical protein